MLVPECLIACAAGLQGEELDKFENWIINPNADLDNVKLVREDTIRLYNDRVYRENLRKFEEVPPLPPNADDADDEKVPEITKVLQESVQEELALSRASP